METPIDTRSEIEKLVSSDNIQPLFEPEDYEDENNINRPRLLNLITLKRDVEKEDKILQDTQKEVVKQSDNLVNNLVDIPITPIPTIHLKQSDNNKKLLLSLDRQFTKCLNDNNKELLEDNIKINKKILKLATKILEISTAHNKLQEEYNNLVKTINDNHKEQNENSDQIKEQFNELSKNINQKILRNTEQQKKVEKPTTKKNW
jgi:methyl-accepting chemotaxis protein